MIHKEERMKPIFYFSPNKKNEKNLTFQVFIEPKGEHLIKEDAWKQYFL
jgi:hypothetical protein|nr:hypothetical protein [uncultured Emticicia sp.]